MTKEEKSTNAEVKLKADPLTRERSSRQRAQKRDKGKPLTKIIIRHLPPTMTEEEFLKQIDPLPEHDFYYYAAADWSLGFDATCRAYLNCKNYEDVFLFRDRFDGYVFVDSKGAEYPAIVEFAPFQGLAKNKSRKIDPKVNSIEFEQHYKSFLEKLEEEREAAAKGGECKLEFSLDRKKEEKITSTPLLQYLANKKEKRREESKRRTEEKRRQREEEKERRQRNQQQVTKIMSNEEGVSGGAAGGRKDVGSKSGAGGSGGGGGKENAGDRSHHPAGEELKNSRTKRRAARDQRRYEEHKQRKRERERLEREQRESGAGVKSSEEVKEKHETEIGTFNKHENEKKYTDAKTEDRKEVKKYSERRERDRKRGRKEQEQRAPTNDEPATGDINTELPSTSAEKHDEISDSVKNFIRSVATVKEFVPKHKQMESEGNEVADTAENNADMQDMNESLEKLSLVAAVEHNSSEPAEQSRMESSAALEEKQLQKQRLAEERRIRNKDRPSIAIYQPKPRLRQSEESDSKDTNVKDSRSNPNSDCESLKKEEQQQRAKKPSRYSERRSERRSKDKRRDGNISEGNADHKPELRKSKSQEESSDISERLETTKVANEVN